MIKQIIKDFKNFTVEFFDEYTLFGKITIAPILYLVVLCLAPILVALIILTAPIALIEYLCKLIKLDVLCLKFKRLFFKEPFPGFDKM